MKIYALFMVMLVVLAGCSTSYKGSIRTSNNPESSTGGRYVVSQAAAGQSGADTGR
jgi:hypothetical protein